MKKRLLIALCCLVLLVQLLPIVPMAETVDVGTVPQELYYCREALKTLENSEALLFAYDNIVAGIDACAEEIIISNSQYQISPAEFEMVWRRPAATTPNNFGWVAPIPRRMTAMYFGR